jgi:sugar lactone lactonase YvrE
MPLTRFAMPPDASSAPPGPDAAPFEGLPRSGVLDQTGHYWVALIASGRVRRLDGNGRTVLDLPVPALYPTGVCLGGLDGCTLFVTSMRSGRSAAELERHPQSGAVFARRVDTQSLPTPLYWD